MRSKNNLRLNIPLFDDRRLVAVRERQVKIDQDGLVWHGKVLDAPFSLVTLAAVRNVLVGNFMTSDGSYFQLRYLGNGVHSLRQVDPSKARWKANHDWPPAYRDYLSCGAQVGAKGADSGWKAITSF